MAITASTERVGVSRVTGQVITGWDHTEQSIWTILMTRIRERVMLLDFGARILDLLDRPIVPETIIQIYAAAVEAVHEWEPNYRILSMDIEEASAAGSMTLVLDGVEFPRGHLGDYTTSVRRTARILLDVAA